METYSGNIDILPVFFMLYVLKIIVLLSFSSMNSFLLHSSNIFPGIFKKHVHYNHIEIDGHISLSFQNCPAEFVSSHKHLELTFSENLKWTTYIDIMIAKAHKS